MTQTHIHLLITHLPIFGSILGAIVLAYGIWTKSNETKVAAYILLLISSIGAGIAYLTGEAAEETVENIQGVVESTIKSHEEFALFAIISLVILGISSLLGRMSIALNFKPNKYNNFQMGYVHQFDYKINDETGKNFFLVGYYIDLFKE
jgi:type IV secretory pathway VirB2 component (pilin)